MKIILYPEENYRLYDLCHWYSSLLSWHENSHKRLDRAGVTALPAYVTCTWLGNDCHQEKPEGTLYPLLLTSDDSGGCGCCGHKAAIPCVGTGRVWGWRHARPVAGLGYRPRPWEGSMRLCGLAVRGILLGQGWGAGWCGGLRWRGARLWSLLAQPGLCGGLRWRMVGRLDGRQTAGAAAHALCLLRGWRRAASARLWGRACAWRALTTRVARRWVSWFGGCRGRFLHSCTEE